ncbi:MFS transporter [Brevibacterium sp. Mu109]|uniref:MFS transporter n=1 Tax=Brevibacterium sp. Mu109 TaxID=1255669 RepID=UPI000C7679E4|nr:MFS transporter [Brevibacterium sp. Mu109]MDN5894586.1 MFS transporter [Nocardioides sp.]
MWTSSFRWLLAGRLVSFLGTSIAPVALVFAVIDIDSSATALGMVLAARTIPMTLFILIGGVIADRFSRSRILVIAHVSSAATQAVAAWLLVSGNATIGNLMVVEGLNGIAVAFALPALNSVVPMVVDREHLQRANAVLSMTRHGAFILGPSIAAGMVVTIGAGWGLALDAGCYVLAAVCMAVLRLNRATNNDQPQETGVLSELRSGWSAFASRQWVWAVVGAFTVVNMVEACVIVTLGPVVASRTFGEVGWGIAMSAEAIGFLAASALLVLVSLRRPLRAGMIAMLGTVPAMLVLGISPEAWMFIAASTLAGFSMEIFGVGWFTALHEKIPEHLMSRVSSYDALGSFIAVPVGQLLAGPATAAFGVERTIVGGALISLVAILSAIAAPQVRSLTLGPSEEAAPP